jgi:hypothetical protein
MAALIALSSALFGVHLHAAAHVPDMNSLRRLTSTLQVCTAFARVLNCA